MPDPYAEFFLTARSDVVLLDLVEITHSAILQPYRYVRNKRGGLVVTIDGAPMGFEYRPIRISKSSVSDDLTQAIQLDVGDPGEVLVREMDRVRQADATDEKPKLRYWAFRSDDLTQALVGPLSYDVTSIAFREDACSIVASAPEVHATTTGQRYTFDRVPMLRGYL